MAQSPADREAQEIEDVERIARTFYETDDADFRERLPGLARDVPVPSWSDLADDLKDHLRRVVRSLLAQEVIAVGRRPAPPSVIPGQIDIHGDEAA